MSEFLCFVLKWIVTNFLFVGKNVASLQKTFSQWTLCSAISFLNFLGLYTLSKYSLKENLKSKTLPHIIHICTASFPLMGQISTVNRVSSRRDQMVKSFDSSCSFAIKQKESP
jgi:hypothetical protein